MKQRKLKGYVLPTIYAITLVMMIISIAFLSQKAPSMKESIRHGDVLIKIGGACQDMLFVSDGTLSVETTSYPIVAASSL